MDAIQKSVVETIHQGKRNISDLADLLGISENMVYRLAHEDSGFIQSIRRIVSIVRAQKRYDIIDVISAKVSRLSIAVPRVPANRQDDADMLITHQTMQGEASKALQAWVNDPSPDTAKRACELMVMEASASIGNKKRIEKGGQLELTDLNVK